MVILVKMVGTFEMLGRLRWLEELFIWLGCLHLVLLDCLRWLNG
jgi:hypothetical protein